MAFSVEISPRAFQDLDDLATELKERSQSHTVARTWFLAILDAIDGLTEMPERCPIVVEAGADVVRVRLLLHGRSSRKYRIYYSVQKDTRFAGTVSVFHIRHWARKALRADEIQELMNEIRRDKGEA